VRTYHEVNRRNRLRAQVRAVRPDDLARVRSAPAQAEHRGGDGAAPAA
jgi:hypothetical protein